MSFAYEEDHPSDQDKFLLNPLSLQQFYLLPYFHRYCDLMTEKQCKMRADKSHKLFKLAKVKKGTVIYSCDEIAENGYIILSGSVKLLSKKNSKQKTEMFPGHILHSQEERELYLYENFKISKHKAQGLMHLFYEDKIQFRFMMYHTLYHNEDFGFGEMVRNTMRFQLAIATEQTELLIIKKSHFDQHLRDFELRKQMAIVAKVLTGCRQEYLEEIKHKMIQIMNTSMLLQFQNQEVVFNENDYVSTLYFVIEGEVEIRKRALLSVPKKYLKSENKGPLQKETVVRVCKIGKCQFIGEQQIFSNRKFRSFSVISTLNKTLILKIDHNLFMKSLTDFPYYEKEIIENSIFKRANANESYEKQYKKLLTSFLNQYEAYDSKKKEKMLSDFINEDKKRSQLFQVYSPEGIFFRDTFQKLEGFQQSQNHPNKKQNIKRFKQKSLNSNSIGKTVSKELEIQTNPQPLVPSQIAEKLLFSPKRNVNAAELFSEALSQATQSVILGASSNQLQRQSVTLERKNISLSQIKIAKTINKFQQIQKDEEVYKRVLIKNGMYPVNKKIDKSKSVKPLVHHNFDEVVRQCISRKNQSIRRTPKDRRDDLIVQDFQKTVQSLKDNLFSHSQQSLKYSRFSSQCKGTQQFKRRMQSIHTMSPNLNQFHVLKKKASISKIQDCIGINEKPKSSQIPVRQRWESLKHGDQVQDRNRKENKQWGSGKIVLLNHMMKPITYYHSCEN